MYAGTRAAKPEVGFTYYLNPMPNDRNVEFDPKRNLFTNLKPEEQVAAPSAASEAAFHSRVARFNIAILRGFETSLCEI
jgi:hypothetical protein